MKKHSRTVGAFLLAAVLLTQSGCATGQTKKIALGMLAGAVVGAVVGNQFVHHGQYKQYQSSNTVITSILFSLGTGAVMSWHYQALEEQEVEISGRYARYRLCNPDEMSPELAAKLGLANSDGAYALKSEQVGKLALSLDDNTKWAYPTFRKRYLPPERGDSQVVSSRYIWEILRPGSFVTRTQNPDYFFEGKEK
ncbi:MAG: hypothetical protein KF799_15165 [Bdellovibrionales bacterium]|nr:hypothetical protein [Bdellovibrionales bacterium]